MIEECPNLLLRGMIPLVLHKVVRENPVEWEDVNANELRILLDFIDRRCATFKTGGQGQDARWILTFDDGNLSDYDIVFPLLIERKMSATFFLITERIGSPGYVDWPKVDEMNRHGMCIGSHSASHRRMTELSKQDAVGEFLESKLLLEDVIGASVDAFSYPFGDCSSQLHQLGFAAGYRYLCTSSHGIVHSSSHVIPRNSIYSAMDWNEIAKVLEAKQATRFRWFLEDYFKNMVKLTLGHERYMQWRNQLLG